MNYFQTIITLIIGLLLGFLTSTFLLTLKQKKSLSQKDVEIKRLRFSLEQAEQDYESKLQSSSSSIHRDYQQKYQQQLEDLNKQYQTKLKEAEHIYYNKLTQMKESYQTKINELKQENMNHNS
jgi:uncharacterized membrane-anchored protein YhcB (DUF1043 family)